MRDQDAEHPFAPLQALVDQDGAVVLAGVSLRSCTLVHLAEVSAGRQPFIRWARDPSGHVMPVRVGGCSDGFDRLRPVLDPLVRRATVGHSDWLVFDARAAHTVAVETIETDPEITRCQNHRCARCDDAVAGGPLDANGQTR